MRTTTGWVLMLLEIGWNALRGEKSVLFRWGAAAALICMALVLLHPWLAAAADTRAVGAILEILTFLTGAVETPLTPVIWLNHAVFGLALPVLFCGMAIHLGSRLLEPGKNGGLAGESGEPAFLLGYPLSRGGLLLGRSLALPAALLALAGWTWALLALAGLILGWRLAGANLAAACLGCALLGLACGSLSLLVCASGGTTRMSHTLGWLLLALAWALNAAWLHRVALLRYFSPLFQAVGGQPVQRGFSAWMLVPLGLALVLWLIGWRRFEQRDL